MPVTTARRSAPHASHPGTRCWASGRDLDRIEQLAFAYHPQWTAASFLRILPVAVDANVLLNAVARLATGRGSDLLAAARLGLIRVYVGQTIPTEVENHLADRARVARVPVAEFVRVWRKEVEPCLRVVETEGFEHPRLAPIIARDREDRPTAVLSLFVGARLTWSSDRDLRAEGYAERLNVAIVVAAQQVGQFDLSAHLALNISSESLSAAGRAAMRAIDRPGTERTIAIVVVTVALGALTVAVLNDAQRVKQTAARVAQLGMEALQDFAKYRAAEGGKLPAIPVPAATEPLHIRLAHALALAPAPLTAPELVAVLGVTGARSTAAEIEATLRNYRAFVPSRHGWQLGSW